MEKESMMEIQKAMVKKSMMGIQMGMGKPLEE